MFTDVQLRTAAYAQQQHRMATALGEVGMERDGEAVDWAAEAERLAAEFFDALQRLYIRAGEPPLRAVAARNDRLSASNLSALLSGKRTALPNYEVMTAAVSALLHGAPAAEKQQELDRWRERWTEARYAKKQAQKAGAGLASRAADALAQADHVLAEAERITSAARAQADEILVEARKAYDRLVLEAAAEADRRLTEARDKAAMIVAERGKQSGHTVTTAEHRSQQAHDLGDQILREARNDAPRLVDEARQEAARISRVTGDGATVEQAMAAELTAFHRHGIELTPSYTEYLISSARKLGAQLRDHLPGQAATASIQESSNGDEHTPWASPQG